MIVNIPSASVGRQYTNVTKLAMKLSVFISMENDHLLIRKAEAILQSINKLESSALRIEELHPLCEEVRELYEQLIVLRYKAVEQLVKPAVIVENHHVPAATAPLPEPTPETPAPPTYEAPASVAEPTAEPEATEKAESPSLFSGFKLNIPKPESKNTLNPSVPKETKEFKPGKQETIPVPDQPLPFNNPLFSAPLPAKEENPAPQEPVAQATIPENQLNIIDVLPVETALPLSESAKKHASINDQFNRNEDATLGAKLGKKPIADLKAAISISQRYLFQKELFKNDNHAYDDAIIKLNSAANREEALGIVDKHLSVTFSWDIDNEHVGTFRELVERRFS